MAQPNGNGSLPSVDFSPLAGLDKKAALTVESQAYMHWVDLRVSSEEEMQERREILAPFFGVTPEEVDRVVTAYAKTFERQNNKRPKREDFNPAELRKFEPMLGGGTNRTSTTVAV